jgi:anti-sigma regulatory factor (Ser/Thr protein kinase)
VIARDRTTTGSSTDFAVVLDLEPDLEVVAHVRHRALADLEQAGYAPNRLRDLAVVLSELLTNAVESGTRDAIGLEIRVGSARAEVSVTNGLLNGGIPPRHEWGPVDVLAHRGRGLAIVEAMAHEVVVERGDDVVTVRAVLPVPNSGSGDGDSS